MRPCFKPLDRPEGEDVWFCHPSSLPSQKPSHVFYKALSQVPDLNNDKDWSDYQQDNTKKYMRGATKPSDTKYIRLAKTGGRKDLLTFVENDKRNTSPQGYPVPHWYCYREEERSNNYKQPTAPQRPDWMTYIESPTMEITQEKNYIPNQDIIAWDKMSSWKRDELDKQLHLKAKNTYQKRKKKIKTNSDGQKLPDIRKSQLQGFRKLSGTELSTQWYKKWYLTGNV